MTGYLGLEQVHGSACLRGHAVPDHVTITETNSHHAWRPVNLNVSDHRQFHLPPVLFTRLMKNWGVPEIIAGEFLHICQNFRGICKSIKNDIFGLENNADVTYSLKGVRVRE